MDWSSWHLNVMSLTAWREAAGEGEDGMRAVLHCIHNRVLSGKYGDPARVCCKPWQFSSMTAPEDPCLIKWPATGDPQFEFCCETIAKIVIGSDPDNTSGATHYFNPGVVIPAWAASMTKVASVGHHDFYRSSTAS